MCPPNHFEVSYRINPWMDPDAWSSQAGVLTALARRQWRQLHDTLIDLGAKLDLVPPVRGLPDMVFTANAAVALNSKILVARFRHPERQRETPVFLRYFEGLKQRGLLSEVIAAPDGVVQEGAGDCVWDCHRGFFWAGFGPRSNRTAADYIASFFGQEAVALELSTNVYYHMDVCLCPLTHGDILYYPASLTQSGHQRLRSVVGDPTKLIEVDQTDAIRLTVNAINIGDDIIMSECSASLRRELGRRGYRVHLTPLDAFQRSGGSACCLTLRLDWTTK